MRVWGCVMVNIVVGLWFLEGVWGTSGGVLVVPGGWDVN